MPPSTATTLSTSPVPSVSPRSPVPTEASRRATLATLATQADQQHLTVALVLAFVDAPIMRWMYPIAH